MTPSQKKEIEELAQRLHEWYLEACQQPESGMDFNPKAQEPYEALKETQKFLDRYIAEKVISFLHSIRAADKEAVMKLLEQNVWDEETLLPLDELIGNNKTIQALRAQLDKWEV